MAWRLDRSYVCRVIQLVNVAPDIAQAIVDGNEPEGFTLKCLREGLPFDWAEQRREYGFPQTN